MRQRDLWASLALLAALTGCTPVVHHVAMAPERLVAPSTVQLSCPWRLAAVEDARAAGDRAGGLGKHMFVFEDAAGVVRKQLAAAGLRDAAPDGAPPVTVRILQLYLTQNTMTKVPVVVFEVAPDGRPTFLVRAQTMSMNWNGTENEAYGAYAQAIANASTQLVSRLNLQCPAPDDNA